MNHLERALDKQNQWWKYVIVVVAGFIASNVIGAIPLLVVIFYKNIESGMIAAPSNSLDLSAFGIDPNLGLVLIMIPFLVALATVILLLKPLHQRNIKEVINGTNKVRWSQYFYSFAIWTLLMGVWLVIDYSIDPANFTIHFHAQSLIPLIIISLLFIPIQTAYEEVLFRGYLAQGVAAWTKNRWLVIILPSLLFGFMHILNPEVEKYGFWLTMPQYVFFGLIFGIVTVLGDGIETAMGAHAANNIFMSVLVTNKASVLQTPALIEQQQVYPVKEFLVLIIVGILFVAILSYKYKWQLAVIHKKIE